MKVIRVLFRDDEGCRWIQDYAVPSITQNLWWAKRLTSRISLAWEVVRVRTLKEYDKPKIRKTQQHVWERTDGGGQNYGQRFTIMRCSKCGVTGKQFHMKRYVMPDKRGMRHCKSVS